MSLLHRLPHLLAAGALALGLAACTPDDDLPAATPSEELPNELTDAEAADGWMLLFDGASTDGWRGYRADSVPSRWSVADGALTFDPTVEGAGGDIVTDMPYDDFELAFEWKISECGNSGVMYRVVEDDEYGAPYLTGPEYQILDNTCHPDAENGLDRTAGANYALDAPSSDVTRPAGEWNSARIVVDGAHVEHWLNGEKVVEYELWSDAWNQAVKASKFGEWPAYGMARSGHIAFQDHGDVVAYRNVKIRPISPSAS